MPKVQKIAHSGHTALKLASLLLNGSVTINKASEIRVSYSVFS